MKRVLVIGASGFVGQTVVADLARRGYEVRAAARRPQELPGHPGVERVPLPDLTQPHLDWDALLSAVDGVVYLAARVHVMNDTHPDPLAAYRTVNRDAALSLARAAGEAGVRRFVYLSSVKVNGEATQRPYTEQDLPQPKDPYGISKMEAEEALLAFGVHSGLEVVVIRPPLVYGPGVKANFMALARAAGRGLPLPIGAVKNQRSMVYVENLADLVAVTLTHPRAAGEVFLVRDDRDLSTPELTRLLAEAQGRSVRLPEVPTSVLALAGQVTGRSNVVARLTESLQVNASKAQELLGWTPPYPVWQAMHRTARGMIAGRRSGEMTPAPSVAPYRLDVSQRVYLLVRSVTERILAGGALLVLSPLLLGLALLIRLTSPGPALFLQERAGQGHQPFRIYKFRSMRVGTPNISTEEMQRSGLNPVTPIGVFLRRTSLDELPQLLNVLKGEMSLVGPRPALMTQTPVLALREASGVFMLKPGITGYAQVTGRDDLQDEEKVLKDTYYLKHVNPTLDLSILIRTFMAVFVGTGTK